MTEAQTSALGRLAELAGVRTDQDAAHFDQSTAALLEEAVSKAESEQSVKHNVPPIGIPIDRIPSPQPHSQATSPSSSHFYAPSSPYGGTPMTLFGSNNTTPSLAGYATGHPYSPVPTGYEQPSPSFAYYTTAGPAGYYQYHPVPYDQVLQRNSPTGEARLESPMTSPLLPHDGFYAVSPTMPNFYQSSANQHGMFFYPGMDAPDTDLQSPTEPVTTGFYGAQPAFAPGQPMAYYGLPGYSPTAQFFPPQQALYSPPPQLSNAAARQYQMPSTMSGHSMMAPSAATVYQPQPPPELARGHLAQSRLHDAAYNRPPALLRRSQGQGAARTGINSTMPKPPPHSDYALWVGNVPGDSNHAELWRFFTSRSGPSGQGASTGVESIHLIAKSNCAFVNYQTQEHLDHAIKVCNGVSLRPGDPRTKDLVCRVRRKEDDAKSGVGAQRGRGMHQHYVRDQDQDEVEARLPGATPYAASHSRQSSLTEPLSPAKDVSFGGVSAGSNSTSSTTSSFLVRHFRKRFFILKSHTEDDLRLSQERSLWATQPHNEPILDQAFRTASEGVYLIFSANKSGEFFGVARMAGPIFAKPQKTGSSGSGVSLLGSTIPEDKVLDSSSHVVASPQPTVGDEHPPEFPTVDPQKPRGASDPTPRAKPSALPILDAEEDQHGSAPNMSIPPAMAGAMAQLSLGPSTSQPSEVDGDGIIRRDTAMTPEERNARLEQIAIEGEEAGLAAASEIQRQLSQQTAQQASSGSWGPGWGRPFKVEWVLTHHLPFARTKHLRNAFNANREVRVARDGTEIEPSCGVGLLAEFEKARTSPSTLPPSLPTSPRPAQQLMS